MGLGAKGTKKSLTNGSNFGKVFIVLKRGCVLMSSSRVRDSSPAIPEPFPVSSVRFFELQECITVFDYVAHERLRFRTTRKVVDLEGQVCLFER